MTKTLLILSSVLLVGCGHMPSTDVKSTENDKYSISSPAVPEQKVTETKHVK